MKKIENTSGWVPEGEAILLRAIELDDIQDRAGSSILVPQEVRNSSAQRDTEGLVVAVGADAWKDMTPRCKVGDRILFTKYAGGTITGDDGKVYRMINAHSVYARKVSEE